MVRVLHAVFQMGMGAIFIRKTFRNRGAAAPPSASLLSSVHFTIALFCHKHRGCKETTCRVQTAADEKVGAS